MSQSQSPSNRSRRNIIIATIAAAVVFVGGYFVVQILAAGFFAAVDVSAAQVAGNAKLIDTSGALNGKALQFTAPPTTPPPTGSVLCPAFPAFPDENCTGYKHTGVALQPENATKFKGLFTYGPDGNIVITTPGTVIEGMDADNCIFVRANNVTIKRSRVRATCVEGSISTPDSTNYSNVIIEDVEIDGLRQSTGNSGISGQGFTCRRCNIHDVGSSIRAYGAVRLYDSLLHKNSWGGDSHNSGMSMRGSNIGAEHNVIRCDALWNCSGAFQIYAKDVEPSRHIDNIYAFNNLFYSSTGYCIAGGWFNSAGQVGTVSNIRIYDNAFKSSTGWPDSGPGYPAHPGWPNEVCGDIGASAAWPTAEQCPSCQWTGNYQFPDRSKIVNPS